VEYDEDDGEGGPEEDLNTFSFEEVQASLEWQRRSMMTARAAVQARTLPKKQAPRPSAAAKKIPSKTRAAANKTAPAAEEALPQKRARREAAAAKKVPPKATAAAAKAAPAVKAAPKKPAPRPVAAAAAKKVPSKAKAPASQVEALPQRREAYRLRRLEQQRIARASLDGQRRAGAI
jgi:hypothetical protein